MLIKAKIGVIGCGHMGSAIVKGLIAKKVASPESIRVTDKDDGKAFRLSKETRCHRSDLAVTVGKTDILIVAVKPQDSDRLLKDISGYLDKQTIVSIMAGVTIGVLAKVLGRSVPVARAMPNMGAMVGESMTAVAFNRSVKRKKDILAIFESIGKVVETEERFLDAVTAVSGSGPAYFFYLADAIIKAGEKIGLEYALAKELAIQTFCGAATILKSDRKHLPHELVRAVASKGGTTEAALTVFEKKELFVIIEEAIINAKKRSEELSKR